MSIPIEYVHTHNLMKNVANLENMNDVTLISGIDKLKFPAHRLILMASSKYFEAMFGPNFREGIESAIPLDGIDGAILGAILDFIYTGRIEINDENIVEIVAAASSMELIALEERCGDFWAANLSIQNSVEVFLNADKYRLTTLRTKALAFICENFDAVPAEDILKIDEENLREILQHNQITAAETVVFDRLVQWMKHNKVEEADVVSKMLEFIRLDHIPNAFLIGTIRPFFKKFNCEEMVLNECDKRMLAPQVLCWNRYTPKDIYCSSPITSQNGIKIQKYDFATNDWNEIKSISFGTQKKRFGSIVFNDELFVMGGDGEAQSCFNSVETFDFEGLSNTKLLPMKDMRAYFTPICAGKYIYALGGYNSNDTLTTCERFDTQKRVWQLIIAMPYKCYAYSVVEFKGKIYIADENRLQSYNPDINSWIIEKTFPFNGRPWLAKSKDLLYAIESNWTVHQYDVSHKNWTTIGWFGNFGNIIGIVSHCDQIYILCRGGDFKVLNMGDHCTIIRLKGLSAPNADSTRPYLFFK